MKQVMLDSMAGAVRSTAVACMLMAAAACGASGDAGADSDAGADEAGIDGNIRDEPSEEGRDPALDETDPAPAAGDAPTADRDEIPRDANSLTLRASGVVDTTLTIRGEELALSGGCTGSSPISLGFRKGRPDSNDYLNVSIETHDVVGPGETGLFALANLDWDHGTLVRSTPGGGEVRVPNRMTGSGVLMLTNHEAGVGDRRLEGLVRSEVRGEDGQQVELVAEFGVNLACGT
ncbi:MAG: hypothetical protein ACODAA_02755 [Gemmatimonadota bacterium]